MTNYSQQYFTIESLEVGNVITFTIGSGVGTNRITSMSWSKDLVNWNTTYNVDSQEVTITVNADIENVYWKGDGLGVASGGKAGNYSLFSGTKTHNVSGNICSLLYGDNFSSVTTSTEDHQYRDLFKGDTNIVSAKNLIFPFATVTGLSTFNRFFYGCTSLVEGPTLTLSTLGEYTYSDFYRECSSLTKVICLATDISASYCTSNWLRSAAASGTFYKHPSMTGWSTGENGIPSGWTIEDYKAFMINGNIPETIKIVHNGVTRYIKYLKFGENLVWEYDGEIPTPDYTPVSYIKTTSLSSEDTDYYWFDTGIASPTSGTIEIDMQFMPLGNNGSIYFGHDGGGSDSRDFRLFWYENTVFCDVGAGRNYTSTNASFNELKHWVWTVDYSTLEFGVKVYGESNNFIYNEFWGSVTVQHILINLSPMKFKSMTIKKNGTTVFDGVAAIDANNVPCIYDSISDTKIYNSGSGQDSGMTYEQ